MVSVLAPTSSDAQASLPDYVVSGGKAVPIPYNGSVARLRFGPATHRMVKRWLARRRFRCAASARAQRAEPVDAGAEHRRGSDRRDVSHLDDEVVDAQRVRTVPSADAREDRRPHRGVGSGAALADGGPRQRRGRDTQRGRRRRRSRRRRRWTAIRGRGKSILFLGRYDESRKGMAVLLRALPRLVERFEDIEILIVGRGDEDELRESAGKLAGHLRFLGQVDDAEKASALRSADVYCAPNTGGESFGIVLVEAMAAGTAVVASDLDAFRRVLVDGTAGRLVPVDDPEGLADGLIEVLEQRRRPGALHRRRGRGGASLRLVGGGRPDHARLRDRRGRGGKGAGRRDGGPGPPRSVAGKAGGCRSDQLDHLDRRHRAGGACSWPCCWSGRGRSRPPTGSTGCTCATTCPGRRSTASRPTRRRRPRGGRRFLRRRAGGQATGGVGRRRRTRSAGGAGGRGERAVRGADDGRPVVAADSRWSPNWPTPRRGCCWPVASTTTPSATPWRCGSAPRCGCCGSAEPPRFQPISRSPSGSEVATPTVQASSGCRRASSCSTATGAVLLFCGSDPALRTARTARAALVVHRRRRDAAGRDARRGRGARVRGGNGAAGQTPPTCSARCGGETRSSTSTGR